MNQHPIADHLVESLAAANAADDFPKIENLPPHDFDAVADDWSALCNSAAESMQNNGCVILRKFVPKGIMTEFKSAVETLLASEPIASHIAAREDFDAGDFFLNCTFTRVPGGKKTSVTDIAGYGRPVINVRTGNIGPAGDDGMIDIFGVDGLFPDYPEIFGARERTAFIEDVLFKTSDVRYRSRLFNLYINRSITATRGYHSDGFGPKVKSFLYLNDVTADAMGPYCYARGTYNHASLRACNVELASRFSDTLKSTTFDYWDRRREVKFLGDAGDFAMTFQSGAHRGWPQRRGKERFALVQTFMPDGIDV
jgi:hypothetical protein